MKRRKPLPVLLLAAAVLLMAGAARAQDDGQAKNGANAPMIAEPQSTGWSLYIDNDILTPRPRDRDYTGGLSATLAGHRAATWPVSVDALLGRIDKAFGLPPESHEAGIYQMHSLQLGMAAFTPGNILINSVTPGDRPYAALVYLANSRLTLDEKNPDTAALTTLTFGVLGLSLVPGAQRIFHRATRSYTPEAWGHQISDGGEPTLRYSYVREHLLASGENDHARYEIKPSFEAAAGFITDASVALSARWGRITTPWWSFSPDRTEYFSQPSAGLAREQVRSGRELYAFVGGKLKVRPYNVFLQGQFLRSDLTYEPDDIRPVMAEAWLGVTGQLSRNDWLSWELRYQTSELRVEPGDRPLVWGRIFLTRYF